MSSLINFLFLFVILSSHEILSHSIPETVKVKDNILSNGLGVTVGEETVMGIVNWNDTLSSPLKQKFKREAPSISNKTASKSGSLTVPERKQRFCLNRLRNALEVVCSNGSPDRTPLFFIPDQYSADNNGSGVTFTRNGAARNLKNEIPAMAQPPRRQLLRRRSRRNIVRECCEKPCGYSNLRKYCSPSLGSLPSTTKDIAVSDGNQIDNGVSSFSSSSSSPSFSSSSSPSHQQCVSVADLQNFYFKYLRKQWKKDYPYQVQGQIQAPDESDEDSIDNYNANRDAATFTDAFFKSQRKHLKESTSTSSSSSSTNSAINTKEESRDANEIDENSKPKRINQSGNLVTAPPIHYFINFPKGTNDDMY